MDLIKRWMQALSRCVNNVTDSAFLTDDAQICIIRIYEIPNHVWRDDGEVPTPVNLSSRPLSDSEGLALVKGSNYAISPEKCSHGSTHSKFSQYHRTATRTGQQISRFSPTNRYIPHFYFVFQAKFLKQISEPAMGLPLPPVVVNIFMESFESIALENWHLKSKAWFQHVDDAFIIWLHGRDTLDSFLSHLNNQHPDIKFNMEVGKGGVIAFLSS
ncbi:hypothetical protein Trydic_g3383 [Trypoxylus dichotomus]